jgi:hypothetical protein
MYQNKYLKYKSKYLALRQQMQTGGKTDTLGSFLKEHDIKLRDGYEFVVDKDTPMDDIIKKLVNNTPYTLANLGEPYELVLLKIDDEVILTEHILKKELDNTFSVTSYKDLYTWKI